MRSFRSAIACLTALAIGGCALKAEDQGKIAPDMPEGWRAAKSRAAGPVSRQWPALFGSKELTKLSEAAVEGNFDLDAAAARILQAEAQARIAASALYPQIGANGNYNRNRTPGTLRDVEPPFKYSVSNRYSLGLTASYALDFWGRNARLAEAGKLSAQASAFDYDTVRTATLAALANTYFQVLLAQERLRIARENIRTANRTLAAIKARLEVGTGTALDVAQQDSVVANQRASVPGLEQQLQQNRNLVAVLLGRTPESARIRGGSLRALKLPRVRPGLPSQLLLRRPDIAATEARLKAAGANIVAARAALYPSITLTGEAGLESIVLRNLLRPEALALSVGAGIAQSIFSGYNLQGQVELSKARRDELIADYRKTIVTALADVENALIAVRKSAEQERLRAGVVAAARRASFITSERLQEGTIDVVTLLNTQLTLFNAQDALILARFQRLQALVSLFQALGGGFSLEPEEERGGKAKPPMEVKSVPDKIAKDTAVSAKAMMPKPEPEQTAATRAATP
ncbi:MAG: efflux transporter outer membrane subunit [Beijerinckiaceae bacterium]